MDSITLGWEDFKAELSNGIDNFISILTTGKESDYSQAYRDDLAMVAGGSKITFEGTEEEYEAVKDKLHPKTKVTIKKASAQRRQRTTSKTTR